MCTTQQRREHYLAFNFLQRDFVVPMSNSLGPAFTKVTAFFASTVLIASSLQNMQLKLKLEESVFEQ